MKMFLAWLLWLTAVGWGHAQEVLTGVSPDGKYGVLSGVPASAPARLVALPSRQTLVEAVLDSQGQAPEVLWSADSRRLFCWIQGGRYTIYMAYRLEGGAFAELTLPNYDLPIERKYRRRPHGQGEENLSGERWLPDGGLVISRAGILRLEDRNQPFDINKFEAFDYAYLVTFSFDRHGVGRVRQIVQDKEE